MENKLARFLRDSGPARFFLPVALILIVFGVILLKNTPGEYVETTGTVTAVQSYTDDEGKTVYDVDFDYDVDGSRFSGSFSGLPEEHAVGDSLTVYYGADDPTSVSNTKNSGLISVVMIVLGAAAGAYGVYATVKSFRRSRVLDETAGSVSPVAVPAKADLTEYYVSFDGNTLSPGYVVEDADRRVVFEAPMTQNSLVRNRIFTFRDRVRDTSEEHEVGHTVTSQYDNEFFSVRSWFSFDGQNVWDALHGQGIRIATDLRSSFPKAVFTVSKDGQFFALIENSSRYVHEEDEAEHAVALPTDRYYFRVWTDQDDLSLLFLTVFAISETDQAVVE